MSEGDRLAAAAKSFCGARFRLGGRDPRSGLDCLGLLAASLCEIGRNAKVPSNYRMRKLALPCLPHWLAVNGLEEVQDVLRPGDTSLCMVGPAQPHLIIHTTDGFVHAHASLRCVVAQSAPPPWPLALRARLIAA